MVKEKRMQTIQTTEHAMELLQVMSHGGQNLTLKALSQRLKIGREEVLILLVAMENRGLVSWDNLKKSYYPRRSSSGNGAVPGPEDQPGSPAIRGGCPLPLLNAAGAGLRSAVLIPDRAPAPFPSPPSADCFFFDNDTATIKLRPRQ